MGRILLLIGIFHVCILSARAQINIEFPYQRIVFQRDLNGEGQIFASGYLSIISDKVQVQLIPFSAGTGTQTDWEDCISYVIGGEQRFYKIIKARQGWYNLHFRAYKDGEVVASNMVQRVGIGEVFLISGQSNAQGQPFNNDIGSLDTHGRGNLLFGYDNDMNSIPPYDLRNLNSHYTIYPTGQSAWCWGELSDMLIQRLNVPVLFMSAGWGGTTSKQWSDSIDSLGDHDPNKKYLPYNYLNRTIQYYSHVLGLRAILWHQGESDSWYNNTSAPQTLPLDYFTNIKRVITSTRSQIKSSVPWVVSKASYIWSFYDAGVISAQERLINEVPNVYRGPYTDTLTNARADGVHFSNLYGIQGLTKLANAWNQSLNDTFFQLAQPVLPDFSKNTFLLDGGNQKIPDGFESKSWGVFRKSFSFIVDNKDNYYVSAFHPCPYILSLLNPLNNTTASTFKFNALHSVEAENKIISSIGSFEAQNNILLKPGFEVSSGSTFTAQIAGCEN